MSICLSAINIVLQHLSYEHSPGPVEIRGHNFTTDKQDIWTGPVQKRVADQEGRPAGQRQSGAGAGKRILVLFRMIEQDQELVKRKKTVF